MPGFNVDNFFVIFKSIVIEAMPFIILGALISGILEELLPQQLLARVIPKQRWLAIAGSALLGLVFPMCECGIVPVMRRLLGKGLPLSCAVAYMLAAPVINPVVIGSTWAAFSGDRSKKDGLTSVQMVTLRVSMAFVTAFVAGSVVDRVARRRGAKSLIVVPGGGKDHEHKHDHPHHDHHHHHGHEHHEHAHCGQEHHHHHEGACAHDHEGHEHAPLMAAEKSGQAVIQTLPITSVHDPEASPELQRKTVLQRLISISGTALRDIIDILAFLILGAMLAAFFQTFGVVQYVPELSSNPLVSIPLMMLLAVLMCLCSEADAFVAANMILIPLGGKISFLVLGPMLDLKLYMMYTRVFRSRLIWTIIPTVVICVFLLSVLAQFIGPWLFGTGR